MKGFWRIHAYNIGGLIYNLDEIEHGVLRRNKGHPNAGKQEFLDDDPRAKVSLTSLDPRIHFALNCGARSCPPIRVYTEDKIEAQLDTASRSFLDQEVRVIKDPATGNWTLELSKLFLWYGADFGNHCVVIQFFLMLFSFLKATLPRLSCPGYQPTSAQGWWTPRRWPGTGSGSPTGTTTGQQTQRVKHIHLWYR